MLPQQNAIQRPACRQLFFACLGCQQSFEQLIDHRVRHACIVLAAFDIGLAGMEVLPLLKAGAQGLIQGHQDHVEVELIQALLVLRAVHGSQPGIDADAGQVLYIGLQDALKVGVYQQYFEP